MASANGGGSGLDAFLQRCGRKLPAGGTLRIALVKGPPLVTAGDPVDGTAAPEKFPAVAKFPVSTVPPDFQKPPWNGGARLYQRDAPVQADDDSDDSDGEATKSKSPKKKRRPHSAPPRRQWILQEPVDFLETMLQRRSGGGKDNDSTKEQREEESKNQQQQQQLSSRYEGAPEHNTSHFVLFRLGRRPRTDADDDDNHCDDHHRGDAVVSVRPVSARPVAFSQPAARSTLSLRQAERAMEEQRSSGLRSGSAPAAKNRLLDRLQQKLSSGGGGEEEADDDVMGDVAYRSRRGGGGARRELLATVAGDGGVAVSDDGVLGGTDDAAFGGRGQRFGRFAAAAPATAGGAGGETAERGADGAAMADDFYTRDVGAEYEELDYDAAEQFDNDDVDMGEAEIGDDRAGPEGDVEDEEDDAEDDDDAEEEGAVAGAAGLASRAVFRAMLKRARGEEVPDPAEAAAAAAAARSGSPAQPDEKGPEDHVSKILSATHRPAPRGAPAGAPRLPAQDAAAASAPRAATLPTTDENGLRLLAQEAVQREIWLNHGSIPLRRLMKIFDIRKRSPEEKARLTAIVKELCTFQNDPVSGKLLVLKQHYSHMT